MELPHLLYDPDSMSTGTPVPVRLVTDEPPPTLAAPTEEAAAAAAAAAALSGMFKGLERSLTAPEPGTKDEEPAAVDGSVVLDVLVTPISTASAST